MDNAEAVQSTNNDASECKRCAIDLKYWKDDYIQYFTHPRERKAPEINRGYFARFFGIDSAIKEFYKIAGSKCQIINLGCGFDTLYWRLKDQGIQISKIIDVDYPTVTAKKCYVINKSNKLIQTLKKTSGEINICRSDLHANDYHIVGVDLMKTNVLEEKLLLSGINYTLPTLFISECVLVYIEYVFGQKLLSWISSKFSEPVFVSYEMVNMADKFGNIMVKNLNDRGCCLAGLEACRNSESQKERFSKSGWKGSKILNMIEIYSKIPLLEKQRIESIEFLDEQELLYQLLEHYAICISWKNDRFESISI